LSGRAGFQGFTICQNCQTHLKIEETETTIETIIITEHEFLTTRQTPIPVYQDDNNEKLIRLQEYEEQLRILETEWSKKVEKFKIKNSKKRILPRKKRSLGLTITGFLILIYSIFFDRGNSTFLNILGGILFFTNVNEFYNWWQYNKGLQEFEEEKERLEMAIMLIDN
jgi:hypothetical protein